MYERVPITGIRESYRPVSGPRTVVMPVLIFAVLSGMVVFYFKGKPAPTETSPEGATAVVEDSAIETPTVDLLSPPIIKAPAPDRSPPLLNRSDVIDGDFTPWMSTLALGTYIRQKNRGHRGSFWSRGNWIRAIEGRWHEGNDEFRIALGTMTRPGEVQWQYRLDLTEIAFAEEFVRLGDEGYSLTQSHAYRHPDGTLRFQAVWQRGEDAGIAER